MFKLLRYRCKGMLFVNQAKMKLKQYNRFRSSKRDIDLQNIRNIGIIAHIDAGKTTTTERMLYYSGFSDAMGEVHDGDTIMDYMPQERERGITITSAAITFKWKKYKINLIDTPGHVDFTIEVERSLCALDGAVVILDSSAGVEVQTLTVWNQASRYGIPSVIYLNKIDKPNSSFEMSLESLRQKLKIRPLILHLPVGTGKSFSGVIDIVTKRKIVWDTSGINKNGRVFKNETMTDDEMHLTNMKRDELNEIVADLDDIYADKFILEGQDSLTDQDLLSAIRRITLKRTAVPVLCGSSYKNIGVQLLMDSVLLYLPNPLESNQRKNISCVNNELYALAFKIIHDKKRGPLTFLRLYSGTINSGQRIFNANKKMSEKVGNLMIPSADDLSDIASMSAGNIVVVTGLKQTITGDTLVSDLKTGVEDKHVTNLLLQVPDPVFFCTIEAPSLNTEKVLNFALECLCREDPTFQVEHDSELNQIIISGMGELHIQVLKERILREYGVDAYLGPLQVAYRETLHSDVFHTYTLDKKLAGTHNYVKVSMSIHYDQETPKFKEVRVIVTKENDLGKIRPDHLKLVNAGIKSALNHGPILGFPVINVKVRLHLLEVSKRTSDPMVSAACSQCIQYMLQNSKHKQLLEPIMMLSITTASGHVGHVLSDLSHRRSQILEMQPLPDVDVIQALTPLSELRGYSTDLRAMTSGTCVLTMEFDHYESMNQEQQAKAIEEVTGFPPL